MQTNCHVPQSMSYRVFADETDGFLGAVSLRRKHIKKIREKTLTGLRTKYQGYDFRAVRKLHLILISTHLSSVKNKLTLMERIKLRAKLFKTSIFGLSPENCSFCKAVEDGRSLASPDEWRSAFHDLTPTKQSALVDFFDFDTMSHQKYLLNRDLFEAHPKRILKALTALGKSQNERNLRTAFLWILRLEFLEDKNKTPKEFLAWLEADQDNRRALEAAERIWISFTSSISDATKPIS